MIGFPAMIWRARLACLILGHRWQYPWGRWRTSPADCQAPTQGENSMNKNRRAQIKRATNLISEAHNLLELTMEQEQAYFNNMSEVMQAGDEGTAAQDALDCFEQALNTLEATAEAAARAGQRPKPEKTGRSAPSTATEAVAAGLAPPRARLDSTWANL
jgi:phage shock protein A